MSTRPCARCGTRIASDQYLCADCREERTLTTTALAGASDGPVGPAAAEGRTWRGRPLPRGMVLPSRTQYHGTMFAFIAAAVAVTMAAAVLVNKGVGPFPVTQIESSQQGSVVSVDGLVRNNGSNAGRARCVATWTNRQGGLQQSGVIQTAVIQPSQATTVSLELTDLTVTPDDLSIDCK